MANRFDLLTSIPMGIGFINVATKTGFALDTAYVYNVSGKAIGYRFVAPVSQALNTVYFFVTAITGAPGNLTVELRDAIAGTPGRPSATLRATQAVSPGVVANKYIACTFAAPFAVTRGATYWIVIGDAAGGAGNNASVITIGGISSPIIKTVNCLTSTNGFNTAGTGAGTPAVVLEFADGTLLGNPYTTSGTYASSTLERGIYIAGLTEDIIINGVWSNASTAYAGIKIYPGGVAPGGTPDLSVSYGVGADDIGCLYFPDFVLRKNIVYRIVHSFDAAATTPGYFQIEDYATAAALLACGFGGGTLYSTIDNGAGAWTDAPDLFPREQLIVKDQIQIARANQPMRGVFA